MSRAGASCLLFRSRPAFSGPAKRVIFTSSGASEGRAVRARRWLGRATNTCLGILTGAAATVLYALDRSVLEAGHLSVHPADHPWTFRGALSSLDHSAIRRGWQVYKTVCSACHSIKYVSFKDLVDVCFTEEEARDIAAEYEVEDGPDENGEYSTRPCKLPDRVPSPYPNEESARAANNGAYPVDLSYVVNARPRGRDYVFGLLTGYTEPPAGVELRDGQAFNPYFEGGSIGMAEMLQDGLVDYDDGTPAYKSQMAKDVVEFLVWTSNQDWDCRKLLCFKGVCIGFLLVASIYPIFRQRMNLHRNTRICFVPRKKPCERKECE
ncbi:cytochrome c-1 like [Nasonia vitripennis]|uniref:Cytochrome c domain-containing protein n=1 Tax=Nasonia vitripennis TaxID=7425 RepID=A0A7M6UCE9_NASVI|nr:cytochrome c-1 like [Nasonia vitripennis]